MLLRSSTEADVFYWLVFVDLSFTASQVSYCSHRLDKHLDPLWTCELRDSLLSLFSSLFPPMVPSGSICRKNPCSLKRRVTMPFSCGSETQQHTDVRSTQDGSVSCAAEPAPLLWFSCMSWHVFVWWITYRAEHTFHFVSSHLLFTAHHLFLFSLLFLHYLWLYSDS